MATVSSLRYEPAQITSTVRSRSRLSLISAQQGAEPISYSARKLAPAPLLRKFHLDEIGVDTKLLIRDLAPTFDDLPVDLFDVAIRQTKFLQNFESKHPVSASFSQGLREIEIDPFNFECNQKRLLALARSLPDDVFLRFARIDPVRTRTISCFAVSVDGFKEVTINRVRAGPFVQYGLPPGDLRLHPRHFRETSREVAEHSGFVRLLEFVVREISKSLSTWSPSGSASRSFTVTLHQMCFLASCDDPFVLPDGIHQDGTDYIVSALPILLDGVKPPVSTVYDLDKRPVFDCVLQVGEALFHDDRRYWHGISAIHTDGVAVGRRGILGLDICIGS